MARPCRIFSRTRSDVYATLIECIECIAPSAVMHAGRVHTSAVCPGYRQRRPINGA